MMFYCFTLFCYSWTWRSGKLIGKKFSAYTRRQVCFLHYFFFNKVLFLNFWPFVYYLVESWLSAKKKKIVTPHLFMNDNYILFFANKSFLINLFFLVSGVFELKKIYARRHEMPDPCCVDAFADVTSVFW